MPAYLTPAGLSCTADEAMSGGRLKPGFREIVADGEYIGASLAFRDATPSRSSVFLTDMPKPAYNMDHGRALSAARYQEDAYQASKASLNAWRGQDKAVKLLDEDAAYERSKLALNAWRDGGPIAALRHARYGS